MHIATFLKNGIDTIEVVFKEYKGVTYLDIRTYSQFDGKDEKQPTKKGVTLKPDQIRALREALQKAEAAAGEIRQTPIGENVAALPR